MIQLDAGMVVSTDGRYCSCGTSRLFLANDVLLVETSYRSSAFAQQEVERDVMVSTPTPRAELILALLSHR